MTSPTPAEVESVRAGSPAAQAGIAAGDLIVRVNGRAPRDYIEYRYLTAEPVVRLTVQRAAEVRRRLTIEKSVDEELGLRFTKDVFDGIRTCRNRCPFCFVSQLPRGLRPALYIRDDDYRLSFLHGTFITLTNLRPADRARIARLHLSPLYVSVHATERDVRRRMFGRDTPDVLAEMGRLGAKRIEFHTQIVICPGINDGSHLERTVRDLASLYPAVRSIGIVPVGLTQHRQKLPRIRPVTAELADGLVRSIERWQRELLREHGSRLVFAADELYLLAGRRLPGRARYEGFPQLGNGIGGARLFLEAARRLRPAKVRRRLRVNLVTGEMAAPLVDKLAAKLAEGGRIEARVCVVRNRLLGRSVTTAGLLAGRDVVRALRAQGVGDLVIVPESAVREGEGFLDGMAEETLSARVGSPVAAAASPADANAAVRRLDRKRAPE